MKLLGVVDTVSVDSVAVARVDYNGQVPVDGAPPQPGLLLLDCPGLEHATRPALLKWLARGAGKRIGQGEALPDARAGALDAIPKACWRVAKFGEVVDLPNFDRLAYLAAAVAPLAEISECLSERIPAVLAGIDAALELDAGPQIKGLTATRTDAQRAGTIAWALNTRMATHIAEVSARVDGEALQKLRAQRGFDIGVWVAAAAAMKADPGRIQALVELVKLIPDGAAASEHAAALLDSVRAKKSLYKATRFAPEFWTAIGPLLDLPANLHESEVSLSDAVEAVATAGWDLWEARRVGRIKLGRKLLIVPQNKGRKPLFVRGTQALLKKLIDAGGRLRHHGVTLTYPTEQRPLTPLLVEVTRIDTLAYVDPKAAIARLGERAPPPEHRLHAIAARAPTDPVAARVLADMLIEFAVGIDADVARKLARARGR